MSEAGEKVAGGPVEWTVSMEAQGEGPTVAEDAVVAFVDALHGWGGAVAFGARSYSATFSVDGVDDTLEVHQRGLEIFGTAAKQAGLPAWPVTAVEITAAERLEREAADA